MRYQQLRRHLESPERIEVYPLWECDDPEPENAPRNKREVQDALVLLPAWARVVCALTAVEMVLPIWEEWPYVENQLYAPRRTIDFTWQWLRDGMPTEMIAGLREFSEDTRHAGEVAIDEYRAIHGDYSRIPYVAYAAADVASAATTAHSVASASATGFASVHLAAVNDAAVAATTSVHLAAVAAQEVYGTPPEEFYLLWWCQCKRRLAIRELSLVGLATGLEESELEWWGI